MSDYRIELKNVTKIFGRRLIFNKINFALESKTIYGLAGSNGSGKSTLSKIIAGIISPTRGEVEHTLNGKIIIPEKLHNYIGFVSPYLVMYDEFTAEENLIHFSKIRGINYDADRAKYLLEFFGIYNRRKDLLKAYSSGMKQRMKFVFAMQHKPNLLLLDEPTSNLDSIGKEKVYEAVKDYAKDNLVIIASNEESDLSLCREVIEIEKYKNIEGVDL